MGSDSPLRWIIHCHFGRNAKEKETSHEKIHPRPEVLRNPPCFLPPFLRQPPPRGHRPIPRAPWLRPITTRANWAPDQRPPQPVAAAAPRSPPGRPSQPVPPSDGAGGSWRSDGKQAAPPGDEDGLVWCSLDRLLMCADAGGGGGEDTI